MSAIVCMYDVAQNYLMISDKFERIEKDEDDKYKFCEPGLVLLWLVLNYR